MRSMSNSSYLSSKAVSSKLVNTVMSICAGRHVLCLQHESKTSLAIRKEQNGLVENEKTQRMELPEEPSFPLHARRRTHSVPPLVLIDDDIQCESTTEDDNEGLVKSISENSSRCAQIDTQTLSVTDFIAELEKKAKENCVADRSMQAYWQGHAITFAQQAHEARLAVQQIEAMMAQMCYL